MNYRLNAFFYLVILLSVTCTNTFPLRSIDLDGFERRKSERWWYSLLVAFDVLAPRHQGDGNEKNEVELELFTDCGRTKDAIIRVFPVRTSRVSFFGRYAALPSLSGDSLSL